MSSKRKDKKTPRRASPKATGSSTELISLLSRVEALQTMLGTAMAQTTALEKKLEETSKNLQNAININWNKFFFHDHRRMDVAGPQFLSEEYQKAWIEEQERQEAAKIASQPPAPPEPASQPPKPKKSDDSEDK